MPPKPIRKPSAKPKPAEAEISERLSAILENFDGVEEDGDGYKALCPAHDDTNPSLGITEGKGGRILFHCRSQGCELDDILDAAGLTHEDISPADQQRVVAEYDYRDEEGELLYQVRRFGPVKTFSQRQPDGAGGWINGTKGVRRVLYRLPELLAAKEGKKLQFAFIVEGEKDVERLHDEKLIAVCNVGGAGKWFNKEGEDEHGYNGALEGCHVVILPDNDGPGLRHAEEVADSLLDIAATVKVVPLPNVEEKGDVSDWFHAGGTKTALLALVKATPAWPENRATVELLNCRSVEVLTTVEVPPFPTEVFPGPLADFLQRASTALPCPPDFLGVSMLAVLGTALGNTCRLQVKEGWIEAPRIYSALIARPGERKSPALELVTAPIHSLQRELDGAFRKAMDAYEAAKAEAEQPPEKPIPQQLVTTDATIESLAVLLNENPRGILFKQDELTGWTRALGQYKGGRGNDRQKWLSFWSGASEVVNRKGQPPLHINNPFVCVTGCIQPDMLGELVDTKGREDGFIHRILVAFPDPVKLSWTEASVSKSTLKAYESFIRSLFGRVNTVDYTGQVFNLSAPAKKAWGEWINSHYAELETVDESLRGVWSKLDGYSARFSLIIHRCRVAANETKSHNIDAESVSRAVKLVDYFKGHARRVYHRMKRDGDSSRLGIAIRWIRGHGGKATPRDILQGKVAGVKNANDARELLTYLRDQRAGTITPGKRKDQLTFTLSQT
jgi:hypothetical protein